MSVNQWKHGLCGCFDNCELCIITYFVPCYTAGKNAEATGESCCLHGCMYLIPILNWVMHMNNRGRIRERQGIDGTTINDLMTVCCCPFCALVQEAQEAAVMTGVGAMAMERE